MSYATIEHMVERFGSVELIQLTNPENRQASQIERDTLQRALDDATAEIEAITAQSFNPVPSVLIRVCCNIARYYLYSGSSTDEVKERYENAIKVLKAMRKGTVALSAESSANHRLSVSSKPSSVFGEGLFS